MALVAYNDLPSFEILRGEGVNVIDILDVDRPTLKIGLLNLMPDAVLSATERQWMRLCSAYQDADLCFHPFTFPDDDRSESALTYLQSYYDTFPVVQKRGLDLLIVTGANPKTSDITREGFWQPMVNSIRWASEQECPVVCSCLATHAVAKAFYGIDRVRLPKKCWGIYRHELLDAEHLLTRNTGARWYGPHSHVYGVTREQLESVGIRVLVDSAEAGVYAAVSGSSLGFIFLQGHPEYDPNSLLKEFKREVLRYFTDETTEFPNIPDNYFGTDSLAAIAQYRVTLKSAKSKGKSLPEFPDLQLEKDLDNSWRCSGRQLVRNLLQEVHHAKD